MPNTSMIVPSALSWLILSSPGALGQASTDCGHARIAANGPEQDVARACDALSGVLGYFRRAGFDIAPEARITFRDRVMIDVYNSRSREHAGRMQVTGYYDAARKLIEVTSGTNNSRNSREPWKQPWSAEISYSILQHELAHMATHRVLGARYRRLPRPWLEFIASAVQFELMSQELRASILASYSGMPRFQSTDQVNVLTYGFDPDGFAVMAYLFAEANGGPAFIRRVLRDEVDLNSDPTLWLR